jgi:hypothetical protein
MSVNLDKMANKAMKSCHFAWHNWRNGLAWIHRTKRLPRSTWNPWKWRYNRNYRILPADLEAMELQVKWEPIPELVHFTKHWLLFPVMLQRNRANVNGKCPPIMSKEAIRDKRRLPYPIKCSKTSWYKAITRFFFFCLFPFFVFIFISLFLEDKGTF